jgi:hypothetical protein
MSKLRIQEKNQPEKTNFSLSYTRGLEERVAFLERKLVESDRPTDQNTAANATPSLFSPQGRATPHPTTSGFDNNPVGEIVGLLALNSSEAPAYVGSSSGLSLAADLGEMVQTSVWNQFISRMQQESSSTKKSCKAANVSGPPEQSSASQVRDRSTRVEDLLPATVEPPTDEMGTKILDNYFTRLHSRYPFLDRKQVWLIHEDRWRLAKTKREDLTRSDRFAIFKLNLVYAIGATMLQSSEKYAYTAPEVRVFPECHRSMLTSS